MLGRVTDTFYCTLEEMPETMFILLSHGLENVNLELLGVDSNTKMIIRQSKK